MKKYLLLLFIISIYSLGTSQQFQNQIFQNRPNPHWDDFEVTNPGTNSCDFSQPQIGVDGEGNFTIIWIDTSNGTSKICCKQFNSSGEEYFQNTLVTSGSNEKIHSPKLAMIKNGTFVLAWLIEKGATSSVEYQQFNNFAIPISKKQLINNPKYTEAKYPSVSLSSAGFKVITFTNWHKGAPKVYGQIINEKNEKIGSNFSIADNYLKFNQFQSSVAFYEPKDFVIVWNDDRENCYEENIYGQNYTVEGVKRGDNYKISWYKNSFFPIISSVENGTYAVVWTSYLFKYPKIIYQLVSGGKRFLTANLKVDTGLNTPYHKSVSMNDNGDVVIGWCCEGNSKNIFAQNISASGAKMTESYLISTTNNFQQSNPEVYLTNKKMYSVWENSEKYSNKTVWANIFNLDDFITKIPEKNPLLANKFQLHQNYPNPFNPSTIIKYSIPSSSVISNPSKASGERSPYTNSEISPSGRNDNVKVVLRVYDILGREVATLVNEKQKPGNYEVEFDGDGLSSGIYFYRLNAGSYIETRKAILLK